MNTKSRMQLDSQKPKVIIIAGPTGIGKTAVAIRIARRLEGEIVNADSMQTYRKMDIGTAKPTLKEQAMVKHHLNPVKAFDNYDAGQAVLPPRADLDAKDFKVMTAGAYSGARAAIKASRSRFRMSLAWQS